MKMYKHILFLFSISASANVLANHYGELSLEELMEVKIKVESDENGDPYKNYLERNTSFGEKLIFTPSIVYMTDVNSASYEDGVFKERRQEDQTIANFFLRKGNVFMKGLGIGAGMNKADDFKKEF